MFEFDERDLIARHFTVEEWLAGAAHERLLRTAIRERQSRPAEHTGRWMRVRTALLMWASHLLVRAGQRLETVANSEQSVIIS